MTIIALLSHSLVNLRRKSAHLEQQRALPFKKRSYGFWMPLIAARLKEAELLISGYVQCPDNAAAGEPVRQLNEWVFHR